jgi:hypothetical protein
LSSGGKTVIQKRAGVLLLVLCCISDVAVAQGTTSILPGQTIQREMTGGESHTYQLALATGQFMHVVVEQIGIDVAVALIGVDGKQVTEANLSGGALGKEPLSHETAVGGDYRIIVRTVAAFILIGNWK